VIPAIYAVVKGFTLRSPGRKQVLAEAIAGGL
jgi:hypothetical protein